MTNLIVLVVDFRAIGFVVAAIVLIGFIAFFVRNLFTSLPELGSEIELAANKKPYLSDEELEGPKLDRSLGFALGMLVLLALAVPLYWLGEPGRHEGAIETFDERFITEGEEIYAANCSSCHAAGGVGGQAPFVLQDADGAFVANANWEAPRLNNVLNRYSEDEVRYVLNFGRPGSPMAAWGTPGGGPLTSQQVDTVIGYLNSIQVQSLDEVEIAAAGGDDSDPNDPESVEARQEANMLSDEIREEVRRSLSENEFDTVGEAVFNLGLESQFHAGSLSCARCHTAGWSLGSEVSPTILDEGVAGCGGGSPSGIGFNLCNGSTVERFPDDTWKVPPLGVIEASQPELVEFVVPGESQLGLIDPTEDMWAPLGGLQDEDGVILLTSDGDIVRMSDGGQPINASGEPYIVLTGEEEGLVSGNESEVTELSGDLADCGFESKLWQPEAGEAYAFDPEVELTEVEGGGFEDPEPLELDDSNLSDDAFMLSNHKIVDDCEIVAMPERTSLAHYEFIYNGAEAGIGYGQGGQSAAGLMPGFGSSLPPELIQAVVDYERGL